MSNSQDAAWRPNVPMGHTEFTWGADIAASIAAADAATAAPAAASTADASEAKGTSTFTCPLTY